MVTAFTVVSSRLAVSSCIVEAALLEAAHYIVEEHLLFAAYIPSIRIVL